MLSRLARPIVRFVAVIVGVVCFSETSLAQKANGACASDWAFNFTFSGPAGGTEKILRAPTFAKLAAIDPSKLDPDHEVFVQSGTRYFEYDTKFQKIAGRKLVLIESGLCVYLTDNDVGKWSITAEAARTFTGQGTIAFFEENIPPIPCPEKPIYITPGEYYGIINSTEGEDQITVRASKQGLACDVSLRPENAVIVDTEKAVDWENISAFRLARFSDFIGVWKRCPYTYKDSNDLKFSFGEKGTINASLPKFFKYLPEAGLSVNEETSFLHEKESKLELDKTVDYQEFAFKDPGNNSWLL